MEEIKRLLCIVSVMNTGGAETFLMKLYRKLDRTKYQMDFCVNVEEKGFYDDEIKELGGRIYVIPCKSENLSAFRKKLAKVVHENQYKYVMRITSNAMGFYDLKIARDAGAKRCIARSSNSSDGTGIKARIAHLIGRLLYSKYVDVMIAPSDLAAKYTFGERAYKHNKIYILHNAIDLKQYYYSEQAGMNIRKEFGIAENTFVVGHVGRFSKQKNHKFLLQVFKNLHDKIPDSILMLVGTGELLEDIKFDVKKLNIEKNVIFTGIRSDVNKIMSAFDIFVFPSFYEGMPNTVIEAQATGLPCVIADTITREANITGLVEYKSLQATPDEWGEVILNHMGNKHKEIKQGFIKSGYDIERVIQEFEKIIFE